MPEFEKSSVKRSSCPVVAFIPIHEGDARLWLDQLLAELVRMDWCVTWHLDNVSDETFERIRAFDRTLGWSRNTSQQVQFREHHRQQALQLAMDSGAQWVVNQDADETWEHDAPSIVSQMLSEQVVWGAWWYNVWQVAKPYPLVRLDHPFIRPRWRFHPTATCRWRYRANIAVPFPTNGPSPPGKMSFLRILHWGFSSPELRESHRKFWNQQNKSEFWDLVCDESKVPWLYPLLPSALHSDFLDRVGQSVQNFRPELMIELRTHCRDRQRAEKAFLRLGKRRRNQP